MSGSIDHQHHLVIVVCRECAPFNFCSQILGGDLALSHGHVTKLWALDVHTVAHSIRSFNVGHAHCCINPHVPVLVSYFRAEYGARATEWWDEHSQIASKRTAVIRDYCIWRYLIDLKVGHEFYSMCVEYFTQRFRDDSSAEHFIGRLITGNGDRATVALALLFEKTRECKSGLKNWNRKSRARAITNYSMAFMKTSYGIAELFSSVDTQEMMGIFEEAGD